MPWDLQIANVMRKTIMLKHLIWNIWKLKYSIMDDIIIKLILAKMM